MTPSRLSTNGLDGVDWDFRDSSRDQGPHAFHPYPAKFISHIPANLIQQLSQVGDVVLDPFCGSGTTLVEAVQAGRLALGADINPVAVLVAQAKSLTLDLTDQEASDSLLALIEDGMAAQDGRPRLSSRPTVPLVPEDPAIAFWFEPRAIRELGTINAAIAQCPNSKLQLLARVAFSSILVSVSRQDSDTRYVRREKHLPDGAVIRRFELKLRHMVTTLLADAFQEPRPAGNAWIGDARLLPLSSDSVDLVVTSPPYPNAYSYHLYHRTRLLWLGFDPLQVKTREIGSHRHYSARGGSSRSTFKADMLASFGELARVLRGDRYACFIIGDSIIRGELVDNSLVLTEAASESGLHLVERITRTIDPRKKSFNPVIGKIKREHILVFRSP